MCVRITKDVWGFLCVNYLLPPLEEHADSWVHVDCKMYCGRSEDVDPKPELTKCDLGKSTPFLVLNGLVGLVDCTCLRFPESLECFKSGQCRVCLEIP